MALGALHKTIRFRITAVAVFAVAIVLIITGVALVIVQRNQLSSSLDETLERRLEILAADVAADGLPARLPGETDDDRFTEIRVDGEIVAATPRPDDDPFRTASLTVETAAGEVEILVGETTDDIDDSVIVLRNSLAVAIPLVLIVFGALVWWLVGRTLRPVEAIRAEVSEIGAGKLDQRVTEPATGDEIAALSSTMNEMLERIDDAVQRQQRFVADASHELRSPLTRVRTQLEVDAARPETADLAETHESVLEETIALQDTVDDLLYLARADSGQQELTQQIVDLDDLVTEEARRVAAESDARMDLSAVSGAAVSGDRASLRRAVRNLLANAGRHATTTVSVELTASEHTAVLAVADDGPGIPADQRERIFERFARLDDARSADMGGTGLGLAITKEIVTNHGGTIAAEESASGGAQFVVNLPLS